VRRGKGTPRIDRPRRCRRGEGVKTAVGRPRRTRVERRRSVQVNGPGTSSATMWVCGSYSAAPPNARATSAKGRTRCRRVRTARRATCRPRHRKKKASEPMRNVHVRPCRESVIVSPSTSARCVKCVITGATGAITCQREAAPAERWRGSRRSDNDHDRRVHTCLTSSGRWWMSSAPPPSSFPLPARRFSLRRSPSHLLRRYTALARDRCDVRLHFRYRGGRLTGVGDDRPDRPAILRPGILRIFSRLSAIAACRESSGCSV